MKQTSWARRHPSLKLMKRSDINNPERGTGFSVLHYEGKKTNSIGKTNLEMSTRTPMVVEMTESRMYKQWNEPPEEGLRLD